MIDTTTILLEESDFKVLEYEAFNPSVRGLFEYPYDKATKGYLKYTQNATTQDKKLGIYKPQLTITKHYREGRINIAMKIQFSAPKLLYGNNFDELEDKDLPLIIDRLHEALKSMYIETTKEALMNSDVVAVHYSKNIILKNISTNLFIKLISKLDISNRLDENQTDFRNGGHSIKYRTNIYEMTFYDKVKDLKQSKISEKRAVEDDSYIQRDFLDVEIKEPLEVVRMEVRLNNKRIIRNYLKNNGMNPNSIQIKNLFHKEVSRRVLLNFWDKYITPSIAVVMLSELDDMKQISTYYKCLEQSFTHKKALSIIGALLIIKEQGQNYFKTLEPNYSRFKKDLNSIGLKENFLYNQIKEVKSSISKMQSLRFDDYKERM